VGQFCAVVRVTMAKDFLKSLIKKINHKCAQNLLNAQIVIALASVFYGFNEENLQILRKGKMWKWEVNSLKRKRRKEKVALVTKY
jgi:hypothetical protein